jgi:CRISPR/Cas system-associated exonuclease Cas4 (RecB family)
MAFTPYNKKSRLFSPESEAPFAISRSKIDLFIECPRCHYLDARHGVKRPSGPAFTLNIAVDELFKKEFDMHRAGKTAHPLMKAYGIDAVPLDDPRMDTWRTNFTGVRYHEPRTNFMVFGAVDDIWVNKKGECMVVDYKATSKRDAINMEEGWGPAYRRQMEVYQWLLRKNGLTVSDTGYFVYANGDKDKEAFDAKLEFKIEVIPYTGNDSWVPDMLVKIKKALLGELPPKGETCEFCAYRENASTLENKKPKQGRLLD